MTTSATEATQQASEQQAAAADTTTTAATGTQQATQATEATQAATTAAEATAAEWDGKVETLPSAAQKLINDLRKEAGDERVAKKTLDAIQKALNPDAKGDEKPTAEQLTKALTEREADAKQAKTELAVYKLAGKHSADADALLDSRAFLAKIADLDPTKTADIEKAIKEAVTNNPKLKTVLAAGASGADFSGGSGEGALTQEKFDSMTPSEKNALFKTNPAEYRKFSGR